MTYRNSEHYADPTAGKAIGNISRQLHNLERKNRRKNRRKRSSMKMTDAGMLMYSVDYEKDK